MKYVTASWSKFSLNNRSYTFFEVVDKITRITRTSIDYCNILRAKMNITQSVNKHSKYWPWQFWHSDHLNLFKFLKLKIRERKMYVYKYFRGIHYPIKEIIFRLQPFKYVRRLLLGQWAGVWVLRISKFPKVISTHQVETKRFFCMTQNYLVCSLKLTVNSWTLSQESLSKKVWNVCLF